MTNRNLSLWIFCDVLSHAKTGSICNVLSKISNPPKSHDHQTVASLTNCGPSKIGAHACWYVPDLFRALGWIFGFLHGPTMV